MTAEVTDSLLPETRYDPARTHHPLGKDPIRPRRSVARFTVADRDHRVPGTRLRARLTPQRSGAAVREEDVNMEPIFEPIPYDRTLMLIVAGFAAVVVGLALAFSWPW